jgi:hypothetical protein
MCIPTTLTSIPSQSIIQYERGRSLTKQHLSHMVSVQLNKRLPSPAIAFKSLHAMMVLPDVESSSIKISRSLLPIVRQLKWSIRRDQLARCFKSGPYATANGGSALWTWLEAGGRNVVKDGERLRLAICPIIRKKICFYEHLDATTTRNI